MTLESIALILLVAAAGGAFGASIGALQAFAFTGFAVIAGEVVAMGGGPPGLTSQVAFGPVLGPQVAFAGGAAAVAYVARSEDVNPAFPDHQAKEITVGLGARPDALAVGAVFGVVGAGATVGLRSVGAPFDPVAAGVVVSALAHRAVLGYDVLGTPARGWFDMSPFERDERVFADGGTATDDVAADGTPDDAEAVGPTRPAVEPWLPYQYRWRAVGLFGLAMGALGGYVAVVTGSPFLAFGISAASLCFLCADVADIPVTHHMTLPASTAVVALAGAGARAPGGVGAVDPFVAVGVGAAFGCFGALAGEVLQRLCYAHADTHLDPPAASIVVSSFAIAVLAAVGVFPGSAWVPLP
jgi:hypothetical protein